MTNTAEVFEIEIHGPLNESLSFLPLSRKIRGRYDHIRTREVNAHKLISHYPGGIPGQRLRLNAATGEAAVVEPLRDPENEMLAERIKKRGKSLPKTEEIKLTDQQVIDWAYYMGLAVSSGLARVLRGKQPKVAGKPRLSFYTDEMPTSNDRLQATLDSQTAAFNRLADAIGQLVNAVAKK